MKVRISPVICLLALLGACGASEPEAVQLPDNLGLPYRVFVTTYHDGDSAWQPFKLEITTDSWPEERRYILAAEQCENVGIVQTLNVLYVFYDELALTGFGSSTFYADELRTLICDLHVSACSSIRDRLQQGGEKLSKICPSRNWDGTPDS